MQLPPQRSWRLKFSKSTYTIYNKSQCKLISIYDTASNTALVDGAGPPFHGIASRSKMSRNTGGNEFPASQYYVGANSNVLGAALWIWTANLETNSCSLKDGPNENLQHLSQLMSLWDGISNENPMTQARPNHGFCKMSCGMYVDVCGGMWMHVWVTAWYEAWVWLPGKVTLHGYDWQAFGFRGVTWPFNSGLMVMQATPIVNCCK